MNASEIKWITEHNKAYQDRPSRLIGIRHPRNPQIVYYPSATTEVKIGEEWQEVILYGPIKERACWGRTADNFQKFTRAN